MRAAVRAGAKGVQMTFADFKKMFFDDYWLCEGHMGDDELCREYFMDECRQTFFKGDKSRFNECPGLLDRMK